MPANPYNLPPTPRIYDVAPVRLQLAPDSEQFVPTTSEEAVEYLMQQGLSELTDYSGREDIQHSIAESLVSSYFPNLLAKDNSSEPEQIRKESATSYGVQREPTLIAAARIYGVESR